MKLKSFKIRNQNSFVFITKNQYNELYLITMKHLTLSESERRKYYE